MVVAYDSVEGIAESLSSYEDFYGLYESRRAAVARGESLSTFLVLGHYFLANTGVVRRLAAHRSSVARCQPHLALVMTKDDFIGVAAAHNPKMRRDLVINRMSDHVFGANMLNPFPHPETTCAHCGEKWVIESCCDLESKTYILDDFDLSPFVGQAVGDLITDLSARRDGEYRLSTFNGEREFDVDHVISEEDCAIPVVDRHFHIACLEKWNDAGCGFDQKQSYQYPSRAEVAAHEEEGITQLFNAAGFTGVGAKKTGWPDHVFKLFESMGANQNDLDEMVDRRQEIEREIEYVRIETDQGTFGFLGTPMPCFDISESGLVAADLGSHFPEDLALIPINPHQNPAEAFYRAIQQKASVQH